MAVWIARALWILGALALIAEMFLLANPRYRVPPASEWEDFEARRFTIRKPKRFRAGDLRQFHPHRIHPAQEAS